MGTYCTSYFDARSAQYIVRRIFVQLKEHPVINAHKCYMYVCKVCSKKLPFLELENLSLAHKIYTRLKETYC